MSKLRDEHWKETSFHEVVRAHLFAEGAKKLRKKDFDALVRFAGYTPEECWKRIRLLYADARRRFLYGEVPPDTRWYVVDRLKDEFFAGRITGEAYVEGSRRLFAQWEEKHRTEDSSWKK